MDTPPLAQAATLVLARTLPGAAGAGAFEVFMLMRAARSAFMPGALVFPGGRLEPQDGDPREDKTWAHAAARECQEEAGLCVAPTACTWFDTWITPSAEPARRFEARFFLAELGAHEGHNAQADDQETKQGRWKRPHDHLADWQGGHVDLPPPTLCTLRWLGEQTLGAFDVAAREPSLPILPKVMLGPTLTVVMPHDPAYAGLPGEARPAPARVHGYPMRLVRVDNRWTPQEPAS